MDSADSGAFLARARHEAARYGDDPWVFVRELLQNSRDAGAREVRFTVERHGGRDRLSCRDDGSGMSFQHARRFLFTLYASSKRDSRGSAGRFGIGFWSVLRFGPDLLVVRSRPRGREGWEARLDGALEVVDLARIEMEPGTEVVLERPSAGADPVAAVRRAILEHAPFLARRGGGSRPLPVRVNGEAVRRELALPAPSLGFRRRGLRGVVGLAPLPEIEVFAHGLKVRDAASFDELLLAREPRRDPSWLGFDGSAPRARIDSRELSVLMARGDAREDAALRRLVAVGQREMRRLVVAELDRVVRRSVPARLLDAAAEHPVLRRTGLVLAGAAVLAAALLGTRPGLEWLPGAARSAPVPTVVERPQSASAPVPLRSIEAAYRGPGVEAMGADLPALDLSYRPPEAKPLFAVLAIASLAEDGSPTEAGDSVTADYAALPCGDICLDVVVDVEAEGGPLRLPLPTGHRLDRNVIEVDGAARTVLADADGRPLLWFSEPWSGRLRYRSGPTPAVADPRRGQWPQLPPRALAWQAEAAELPLSVRAAEAANWVAESVRYESSPEVVAAHEEARRRGLGLFEAALTVGAGDCDVQNALLAAMLDGTGVPSRLAVGWVGVGGRAAAGLHAWVEYLAEDGSWRAADASVTQVRSAEGAVARPAPAPTPGPARWLLPCMAAVLAVAVAVGVLHRRSRRRSHLPGSEDDIVGMLRGVAARPEAFTVGTAVLRRPVVPRAGRGRVSIARARGAAAAARLAVGLRGSRLAGGFAAAGGLVLDGGTEAGAAVAEVLAAVDLERWEALLEGARTDRVTAAVEQALRCAGDRCRVAVAHGLGRDTEVLGGGRRWWVLVDETAPVWRLVTELAADREPLAILVLADFIAGRLGLPAVRRSRCLARLARAAIDGHAAGGP